MLAGNPNTLDAADVTLRWLPATDPDAEMPTYEVRIDSDGEILQSYTQQLFPGQGATSVALAPPLAEGVVYTVAVRARDAHGAYSPWSAAETFTVATPPPVTVNGNPVASLRAASRTRWRATSSFWARARTRCRRRCTLPGASR